MESVGAASVPRGLQPSVGSVTEGFYEAHVLRIVLKWLVKIKRHSLESGFRVLWGKKAID